MNKQIYLRSFIEGIPKAELHLHIEGTLEPELMIAIARRNNDEKFKYRSIEKLRAAYHFKNLDDFLDIYYEGVKVLKKEQDFYDLTIAYLKKVHSQNVLHTEIFFDPQAHTQRERIEDRVDFETVITGIHRALAEAEKKLEISTRLIMCFLRHLDKNSAMKTLEEALPYRSWITAVGLDSYEKDYPPSTFREVFDRAREEGWRTVAHAGEEAHAHAVDYIREAINELKVSRIDHGIRSLDDENLVSELRKRARQSEMALTICPLSNLKLGLVRRMEDHPIKELMKKKVRVTINSDDPAYFGGYINENYLAVQRAFRFKKKDIYRLARNSFEASFVGIPRKREMIAKLDEYASGNHPVK